MVSKNSLGKGAGGASSAPITPEPFMSTTRLLTAAFEDCFAATSWLWRTRMEMVRNVFHLSLEIVRMQDGMYGGRAELKKFPYNILRNVLVKEYDLQEDTHSSFLLTAS